MDDIPRLGSSQDLELRASRVADPNLDLKTKIQAASELRELIDTVRDAEATKIFPGMVPVLLEILHNTEVSIRKDSPEYQFRRALLDILHRITSSEGIRQQIGPLMQGALNILRQDNEENGVTCCKIIADIVRIYRTISVELVNQFMAILVDVLRNMKGVVDELFSEDSAPQDPNVVLHSKRSFKVLIEMGMIIVTFTQVHRTPVTSVIQSNLPLNLEVLSLEAPAQKKAREDYEAMGGFWAGMAPTIRNPQAYTDFIIAQIKLVSYLAYIFRHSAELYDTYGNTLLLVSLRLLQDIPAHAVPARKDFMIVFRHLLGTPYRTVLLPQIDKLLDESILLGPGVGSRETLRATALAAVADLVHHLRNDLTTQQLAHIIQVYSRHIHNPCMQNSVHTLAAKMIFNLVDTIAVKETQARAAKIFLMLMETCVDKLDSIIDVLDEVNVRLERSKKQEPETGKVYLVEKARPVAVSVYAIEKPEDVVAESRLLFRTLIHGFRACITCLRKVETPLQDGSLIMRMFEGCIRCMCLYDTDARDANEALDWLSGALTEVNLHIFQEVWTQKVDFFFKAAQKRPGLLHICQTAFQRESTAPTLIAIFLRHLIGLLPELGEYDDTTAIVAIRLFKMTFNAISPFPHLIEPILASHLSKLIMDCFPLAAKSSKPTNYYHLLRALFRAMGAAGGKYELLYKEVLPLLPEMLANLNTQLMLFDGWVRDMIVELCLTVPLRLTHLLPHLHYLMKPLVYALRGGQELVTQGLRTLELCIDNLTPDFLDPTLNTVLRELMEALQTHLKPLPANHQHAHSALRILGKLGGRNRRLLEKDPEMKWNFLSDIPKVMISFGGNAEGLELGSMAVLATKALKRSGSTYRVHAYNYLENTVTVLWHQGVRGRNAQDMFVQCLEALFDAIHLPEVQTQAEPFIRDLSRQIFTKEIQRGSTADVTARRYPSHPFGAYLDAMAHSLARESVTEAKKANEFVGSILQDFVASGPGEGSMSDMLIVLSQVAGRFNALCVDEPWIRKRAGCNAVKLILDIPDFGMRWITEREPDIVRTFLHVLKNIPQDLTKDTEEVLAILTRILKTANTSPESPKIAQIIGLFYGELLSMNPVVRQASENCIGLLSTIVGKSASALIMPQRDRVLNSIYQKPLRALPFAMQIGFIDAMRFCVSLDPPLPELNEELMRHLHEALALADADDQALLGRANLRQGSIDIMKLRVASIRLLTASMPMTDFFAKYPPTRQRVTSVYFKSLYSPSAEVKDAAHEGLRIVLTHQSRLPKELLQTGLRPILMNLADPKRLSVPGLEGLARLLELLNNYFKVEIGHKLLDHFRIVADPQMLHQSSRLPLAENDGIMKLVRLTNIFHLLPSAANIFLENLVNVIVQVEAQMHFSGPSPFSEPLAKYLNRYPIEAMDFFMKHIQLSRHLRTLRNVLQEKRAPHLQRELAARTHIIVSDCLSMEHPAYIIPGLQLCLDLANIFPAWVVENSYVIDACVRIWRSETPPPEEDAEAISNAIQRHTLIIALFEKALQASPRVDLLFEIITIYTRSLPMDLVRLTRFLYQHAAFSEDLAFQRNILYRFLKWFSDPQFGWASKTFFMRVIITPMLLIRAKGPSKDGLLDDDIIAGIHRSLWHPVNDGRTFSDADDMFSIELLHLTTTIVQYYHDQLEVARKDIVKCAWHYITSEDMIVKQVAYLLAARFFDTTDTPLKFILRAWTGLLKPPHHEGRNLVRQALDTLAPALPRSKASPQDTGPYPQWAKTTRRLLAEDSNGLSQLIIVYQLIVRQSDLFYPVRALFIPHMVNSLSKLGLHGTASGEARLLTIDMMRVIFEWEQKAIAEQNSGGPPPTWLTPLGFRESIVSYTVGLATAAHDPSSRQVVTPKALELLRAMVGKDGWSDVTVKLNYFSRQLEQNELNAEAPIQIAISASKVLQVVAADKDDEWFTEPENATILQRLVRKGMVTDEPALHDALYPVFERLMRLFPLPKEDEEQQSDASDFHKFVHDAIGEGLRNGTALRGTLLMLKSVVQVVPERVETFSGPLVKLLNKLAKDHSTTQAMTSTFENTVRLITAILEICQLSASFLGNDQRRFFIASVVVLVEKSKSPSLCRYMLDMARDWALNRREPYPIVKEKATVLLKMLTFEARGDTLFNSYLELIYEIYTEPSLRRSDLTTKMESAFLVGCRARDPSIRERFIDLLDVSVPRSLSSRLSYILGVQSWEPLADSHWIYLALHLLLGTVDPDTPMLSDRKPSLSATASATVLSQRRVQDIIRPMQRLLFLDPFVAHDIWVSLFSAAWSSISRREQSDITHQMISLLSKDYHSRQAELRPNVVQTLLTGSNACSPPMTLPPHLVKYLAKAYGAWHPGFEILQTMNRSLENEAAVRDSIQDALAELYAELAEDDLFYGLWRRRSLHMDTNIGISFEQNGMWEQAAAVYEAAQGKVRSGTLPFSEQEYCLWEDHWILAAEKLQQWDILYEYARSDNNQELMLESAWRTKDWAEHYETLEEQIAALPSASTPRSLVFKAFVNLLKMPNAIPKNEEFTKLLEDAMQLTLRKWVALPQHLSTAHVPLLQHFQQFVELQEAVQIFGSLSNTTAQNLEKRSSDLKMVLQAWRERLPNRCDDISVWSDLVAWRTNVFNAINRVYVPLITDAAQAPAGTNSNTYGYRGYHETAWIINRFAHTARKHDLLEVCFSLLNKIYTLPNIEISEAFLKLREQARCHYQKPNDLQASMEVINNTNLVFFSMSQKAEFYTLKGMFHAKAGRQDDADSTFSQAVSMDMGQAKAWAEWGKWNDRMFKDNPDSMSYAAHAISCYLQAAGLYKNGKSRPLLTRILWLLSIDDPSATVARAFDQFKGDHAFWYWISLVPQLCLSVSHREVKQARFILLNLAKLYPQALFFHLRTTREDMLAIRKQNLLQQQIQQQAQQRAMQANMNVKQEPGSNAPSPTKIEGHNGGVPDGNQAMASTGQQTKPNLAQGEVIPKSYDSVEEVAQILRTAFPLLIMTMETMVAQLHEKFNTTPDEECYRLICMLLQDAYGHYEKRLTILEDNDELHPGCMPTLKRFSVNLKRQPVVLAQYEADFINPTLSFSEYIRRLQQWRDRYELILSARPRVQPLDLFSHWMTDFQYTRFDDVEIPGQYTEDKDNNAGFAKIARFGPHVENYRSLGYCSRRFTIHASDNTQVSFSVQVPLGRHTRREERIMQVLRTFNGILARKKESRKRNLAFHIPVTVPCSPALRLMQNDASYVTFGDIFEKYCQESNVNRDDTVFVPGEKIKKTLRIYRQDHPNGNGQPSKLDYFSMKKEVFDDIQAHLVPDSVISQYLIRTMDGPTELWRMRKQFSLQIAATNFMTYLFCLTSRTPTRFHLSRTTGLIAMSELLPGFSGQFPLMASSDHVPFRFTPNIQHFIGPIHTEGIVTSGMLAIGRSLTQPQYDLESQLCLLSRDEVITWLHANKRPYLVHDLAFRKSVQAMIEGIVKRAESMACRFEREANPPAQVPVVETVVNLISMASDPMNLVKMMDVYQPWF